MTDRAQLEKELALLREEFACVQRLGKNRNYQSFSKETQGVHCRCLARLQKQGEAIKAQLAALEGQA